MKGPCPVAIAAAALTLMGLAAPHGAGADTKKVGNFFVRTDENKFDDSKSIIVFTLSKRGMAHLEKTGKLRGMAIGFRCIEGNTSVILYHLPNWVIDSGVMRYRIGRQPARRVTLQRSGDSKGIGWWRGATAIPVARTMMAAEHLVVEMARFADNPQTAEFNLRGLSDAIKPLRKACNW